MNTQNLLLKAMAILTIMPLVLISRPKGLYWQTRSQAHRTGIMPVKRPALGYKINARA